MVKIWDLRHSKCVKIIKVEQPESVTYDLSSLILGVVSEKNVRLYDSKSYEPLSTDRKSVV